MRRINKAGLDLLKGFEGLSLKPYLDGGGVPTIGYGTIMYEKQKPVSMRDAPITEERATELLEWELEQKCSGVEHYVTVEINDNEFAALVSFAYNLGLGSLHGSTLLKLLNAGADRSAVADQFLRWNKDNGLEVPGLTRRRQAERSLFLQPVVESDSDDSQLPSGPSDEDIDSKLQSIEDDIMKK